MWSSVILCKGSYRKLRFRSYSKLSYIHNPGKEAFRSLTVGKLLEEAAHKYSDRPAIISRSQNRRLTFQEVLIQADRLAAGLTALGLNVGDRVGIWSPSLIEWYITHMACARGGHVLVNLNPAYQPQEIENCIKAVGMKCIVCAHHHHSQNYYEHLLKISPEIVDSEPGKLRSKAIPSLESIIFSSDEHLRGTFNFQEIMELASEEDTKKIQVLQDRINPDQPCHLQFTSGTTGIPKAPVQSHFHLVNNSYFIGLRNELDRKHHIVCVQVPLFHAYGTAIAICGGLNHGSTLVLPAPGFDPNKSLDAIRDEKCTFIYGTPTMYVDLINRQKARKELINLDIAVTGGAACSPHLFKEIKEVLNVRKVKSVYGLTETTATVFQSMHDDEDYELTSTVGYIGDHIEAKVVDSEGITVPMGTPGELLVRGYCMVLGYWQNEEKTKELIGPDRWLRTGDQFILEENGYGRIVGRLKEVIIRGGENIFPREIEDLLNTHPSILESHVVGVPNERLGEEVCACIRTENDISLTLEDIKLFCKGKMAHFKIPSILKIVDSFPKTTSGKIQKYELVKTIVASGK